MPIGIVDGVIELRVETRDLLHEPLRKELLVRAMLLLACSCPE